MAKKFVRGITDIKQINQQDFDTNNVNDLLSDGEYNYIHRKKKDKSEEYHNLTDNIKTISSDNTDLLSVTNYNKSNNTATLHPHHDAQKEQVLESTRNTISINHGTNGNGETLIDVNASKVALLDNIHGGSNVRVNKSGNVVTISASGGLTPLHQSYGARGTGYYVFKEIFGMRTTYTIEVVQGEPELTVVGDLKTDLVSKLANVSTLTNGGITLTYDGTNVKIITNTSPASGVNQATFTFYNS